MKNWNRFKQIRTQLAKDNRANYPYKPFKRPSTSFNVFPEDQTEEYLEYHKNARLLTTN